MNSVILMIVTYTLIAIVFCIVVLVLIKKKRNKKFRKTIEERSNP